MNVISILGLLTLLALAWAMSYHRRSVRWQPVLWGLGLQVVLALTRLRQEEWSTFGMVLLGLLVVSFISDGGERRFAEGWRERVVFCGFAAVTGLLLLQLSSQILGVLFLLVAALLLLTSRQPWRPLLRRSAGALLVVLGLSWTLSRGLTGHDLFQALGGGVASFLQLSGYGARFLFGNLADPRHFSPAQGGWPGFGFQFAFYLLPVIIFFAAFMSVLYHLGIMQRVIESLSRFMRWTMGTSGVETLSCSANMFIGQTEAPLLVRPYLAGTTRSELLTIMVGGFATIAGSGLAVYIAMGVPAAHLLAASVMWAPGAMMIAKMIYPELEHSETAGDVDLPKVDVGANIVEAASNGISDGLKLALNVGAMLIGFIALIAVFDVLLSYGDALIDGRLLGGEKVSYAAGGMSPITSEYRGVFPGSLQTLFGTLFQPLAWMMGVPWADAAAVGHLLGVKLSLNEFVAYGILEKQIQAGELSERAVIISTYALCGFANFSSIGIQLGGLGALAPDRRKDLAQLGLRAMLGGALASWLTATIAGILL